MKKEIIHRLMNAINRLTAAMPARALPVLMAAVVLCVSCSKDKPDYREGIQPLSVNFRMSVPVDASAADGSEYNEEWTWGDEYNQENALSAENRILWDDFYVAFFSKKDGSYIGHLDDVHCINLLPRVGLHTYECRGVLKTTEEMTVEELVEKLNDAGDVKVLVTANVANLKPEILKTGISDITAGLGTVEYSCNGTFDRNFPAVPMWGVTVANFSELTPGMTMPLGDVALLRSVAKVEVLVSEDLQQVSKNTIKLKSVSVSRMNTTGYVLPGNWNSIYKTGTLKFSETLRVPEKAESEENKTFNVQDDGRVLFYLPECDRRLRDCPYGKLYRERRRKRG